MTDVSASIGRAVVIATPDAKTRAGCIVQLAQRGETIVSAADFKAPHISDSFRSSAIIAIAETLLPTDASHWRDVILDHGWCGKVIVLGSPASTGDPGIDHITYLPHPLDIKQLIAQL